MSLRVGLVGCGRWGRHILRDLRSLGCEVPVVARSPESRQRASDGGAAEIVDSIGELSGVDGIVIATPEDSHAAVNRAALELGVPVFCEKPLTVDPASAAELAALAPDRLFCMDKWRYHPGSRGAGRDRALGRARRAAGAANPAPGLGQRASDLRLDLAPGAARPLDRARDPRLRAGAAQRRARGDAAVLPEGSAPCSVNGRCVELEVSSARHVRDRSLQLDCADGVAWLADPMAESIGIAAADAIGAEPSWRAISQEMPLLRELRAFVEHLGGGAAAAFERGRGRRDRRCAGPPSRARRPRAPRVPSRPRLDERTAGQRRRADATTTGRPCARPCAARSAQSHTELELLIVGDGMPAEAAAVARELAASTSSVRLFEFDKGERHGEAHRHTVITEQARGEYVFYLSDDDLLLPDHVETMLARCSTADVVAGDLR